MFDCIKRFFKKPAVKTGYYDFLIQKDKEYNVLMQRTENDKWDALIRNTALQMYHDWVHADTIDFGSGEFKNFIPLIKPLPFYVVYDMETAKHLNIDIIDLIKKEYAQHLDNFNKPINIK